MAYETIGLKAVLEGGDKFLGDLRAIDTGVAKVGTTMGTAQPKMSGFGSSLKQVATIAAGFTVGNALMNLPGTFMGIISSASNLNESMNKMKVVFGEASDTVEKFSKNSANAVGLSQQKALEATATFGNLFTSMGLGKQASADMSIGMLKLAGDIASFNNISVDEALMKLRSGLVGEAEPLRTVGILLDEETVKLKAVEMGLASSTKEVDSGAKVQARYALMLEQSKNATGDFARTSDGFANQQRILTANLQNLSAVVGTALLPVMQGLNAVLIAAMPVLMTVAELFADVLTGAINAVITVIKELADAFSPIFEPLIEKVGELGGVWESLVQRLEPVTSAIQTTLIYLEALWRIIKTDVIPAFADWAGGLIGDLVGKLGGVKDAVVGFIQSGLNLLPDAFESAKEALQGFWDSLGDVGQKIAMAAIFGPASPLITGIWLFRDELIDLAGTVWEFAQELGDALLEAGGNVLSFVADAAGGLSGFAGDVAGWIGDAIGVIADFGGNVADAMGMAAEGVAGLAGIFAEAMGAIIDVVSTAVTTVYELLSYLNPFAEHSPSLVSEVTRGVDEIIEQYSRLPDSLDGLKDSTEQLKLEQAALDDAIESTKTQMELYKNIIDAAEDAIQNLRSATIAEAVPFDEASKAIENQSDQLKLQINLLKQRGGALTEEREVVDPKTGKVKKEKVDTALGKQIKELEDQLDALGLKAEEVDLKRKLEIGPMEEQIKKLTNTTLTLSFQQIVDGIKAQKDILEETVPKYEDLEVKMSGMETASKNLGSILKDIAEASKGAAGSKGGGGLAGVGSAADDAKNSLEDAKQAIKDAKEEMQKAVDPVVKAIDNIKEAWRLLKLGFEGGKIGGEWDKWEFAAVKVGRVLGDIYSVASNIAGIAWDALQSAWEAVSGAVSSVDWGTIGEAFAGLGLIAWDVIQTAWEAIRDAVAAVDWGAVGMAIAAFGYVAWEAVKAAAETVGTAFGGIDWASVKDGVTGFGSAATDTSNWASAWTTLQSVLAPVADYLLPKLKGLWSDIKEQTSGFVGALGGLVAAFAPLMPLIEPLARVIGTVLVVALGMAIDQTRLMVTIFGTTLTMTIQAVTGIITVIVGAITGFVNIVAGLISGIGSLISAIGGLSILDAAKALFEAVGNFLKDVFTGAVDGVSGVLGTLSGVVTTLMEVALEPLRLAFEGIQKIIDEVCLPALQAIADFFGTTVLPKFQEAIDFIGGMAEKVGGFIVDVKNKVNEKLGDVISAMVTGGEQIVKGLWSGIQSMAEWLYNLVFEFGKKIFGKVKDGLGDLWPFSPSVAGVKVGEGLMLGIEKGIEDGMPAVEGAVITLTDGTTRRLDEGLQTMIDNSTSLLDVWKNIITSNFEAGRQLSTTEIQAMFADIVAAIQNSNLDTTTKQELLDVGRELEAGWRANGSLAVAAIVAYYNDMIAAIKDGNAKAAAEAAKAPAGGGGGSGDASIGSLVVKPGLAGGGTHKQYVGGGQYVDVPNEPKPGDTYSFGTYTDAQGKVHPLHTMTYGDIWNPVKGKYEPGWTQNPQTAVYAKGTINVPENQLAFLHKGEMVIPAPQASVLRALASKIGYLGAQSSSVYQSETNSLTAPTWYNQPGAVVPSPASSSTWVQQTTKVEIDLSSGNWVGTPEENATAIEEQVEAVIQEHFGRGAWLAGART